MILHIVVDVAVYDESNPLLGQAIVARVALAKPEPVDSLKARIRLACKSKLAAYKAPARVLISQDPL